jgi:hypothetical protein
MALQRLEEIKNLINNQINNVNAQFNKQKNKDLFIKRINTNKKLKYSAKFISIIKHRIIKQKRINYLENIRLKRKGMISLYKYSFVNQIYKKHLLKYVRSFINIIHKVIKIKKYYKYVSIKLTKHSLFNDIEDPTEVFYIIYCYDKKNPSFTVINSDSTKTMIFDKENYFLIDHNTREIACINKCNSNGKKAYWNMKNHAKGYLREMPYYHQLLEKDLYSGNQLIHKSVTDTFIDGKKNKGVCKFNTYWIHIQQHNIKI